MSFTERGTLMVVPFLLSTLVLFKDACSLVFSTTRSATFLPLETTSSEVFFVALAAFLAFDLVALAVDFAAAEALALAALAFSLTDAPAALTFVSTLATP